MPQFVPSFAPSADAAHARATFVYFRGGDVLTDDRGALFASPEVLAIAAPLRVHLGSVDGAPCFAIDVAPTTPAPGGARFVPLRVALATLGTEYLELLATGAELVHFERTHQRCGACGGALVARDVDRARRCDACAVDHYPRIAPAIIVLVRDGRRALLTHAKGRPFFALVAGFLEPGETLEQCVAREVREETGLTVDDVRYFGSQPWPFPSQIMIGFFARYVSGTIVVDQHELDDAQWFDVDALPDLPPSLSIARKLIDAWIAETRA